MRHLALILFLVALVAAMLAGSVLEPQAARIGKVVAVFAAILAIGGWLFHRRTLRRRAERAASGEHPMRRVQPHD